MDPDLAIESHISVPGSSSHTISNAVSRAPCVCSVQRARAWCEVRTRKRSGATTGPAAPPRCAAPRPTYLVVRARHPQEDDAVVLQPTVADNRDLVHRLFPKVHVPGTDVPRRVNWTM